MDYPFEEEPNIQLTATNTTMEASYIENYYANMDLIPNSQVSSILEERKRVSSTARFLHLNINSV